ncbi:MAG: squalene/phytoene synthase family protein [Pseudomonadota bacterium]
MEGYSDDSRQDAGYCADLVRIEDRDRFLAAQFAPPDARGRLLALLAVNAEIARAARAAREPVLLRIRIQWWREAVAAVLDGRPSPGQPALAQLARAHGETPLDHDAIERLLSARERDFVVEPLAGVDDAVAHAEAASGSLARLALRALDVADPAAVAAARSAGIAFGLMEMVNRVPFPLEAATRAHIAAARDAGTNVPVAARAVMLWVAAAEARLVSSDPTRSPPLLPLTLAWRAWRRTY